MTDASIKDFYDDHYFKETRRNPAYVIYDRLRIGASGSHLDFSIFDNSFEVYAFDLSENALRNVSTNTHHKFVADALNIPIKPGYFNIIVCSEVLEHIPNISQAVSEIRRVINPQGVFIVSSPNWISWFGLSRWIAEKIFKKEIHSSDQPYDDWKTIKKFQREMKPGFNMVNVRGVWFLPPLHYRDKGISTKLMNIIYKVYAPYESIFSRYIPGLGHLIVLKFVTSK